MVEHPSAGRMTGHPGPLLYRLCKQCGMKIMTDRQESKDQKTSDQ